MGFAGPALVVDMTVALVLGTTVDTVALAHCMNHRWKMWANMQGRWEHHMNHPRQGLIGLMMGQGQGPRERIWND